MPAVGTRALASGLLLAGLPGNRSLTEPLLEPGDTTAGVEDLLLARVERVAVRAHIGVDHAVWRGGPRHECVPASTGHGGDLVGRVNARLHLVGSLSQAVAGSPRGGNRYRVIVCQIR